MNKVIEIINEIIQDLEEGKSGFKKTAALIQHLDEIKEYYEKNKVLKKKHIDRLKSIHEFFLFIDEANLAEKVESIVLTVKENK